MTTTVSPRDHPLRDPVRLRLLGVSRLAYPQLGADPLRGQRAADRQVAGIAPGGPENFRRPAMGFGTRATSLLMGR